MTNEHILNRDHKFVVSWILLFSVHDKVDN